MAKEKLLDKNREAREAMIDLLRERGIKDEKVLSAMMKVERHLFVPVPLRNHAYDDAALPIGDGQTISQPYTVALMTEALNVKEYDKVLEIGTGSGYQTAVLCAMGVRVFTIERIPSLLQNARKILDSLNMRYVSKVGDGTIGWREFAPFDGIVVTAGAPEIPMTLVEQLKVGARLVIPVGTYEIQQMKIVTKKSEAGEFEVENRYEFKFVPLIGREGWQEKDG